MENTSTNHPLGKGFEGFDVKDILMIAAFFILVGAASNFLAIKIAQRF